MIFEKRSTLIGSVNKMERDRLSSQKLKREAKLRLEMECLTVRSQCTKKVEWVGRDKKTENLQFMIIVQCRTALEVPSIYLIIHQA